MSASSYRFLSYSNRNNDTRCFNETRIPSSELDQLVSTHDVLNSTLHSLEAGEATRFTLEVVDDGRKRLELLAEESMAEVTLVAAAIEVARLVVGFVLARSVVADQLLGQDAARVLATHELVQRVAVGSGSRRAGTKLEVVRQTRGCGPAVLAEMTLDVLALVYTGMEML